jgi:hypothetical protein
VTICFRRRIVLATLLCLLGAWRAAAADTPAAPRLAVVDEPEGSALRLFDRVGTLPFQVAVCIGVVSPADPALDARLTTLEKRHVPVWLIIAAPDNESAVAAWQTALHGLLDKHGASLAILEVSVDHQPARIASFALEIAATEARANREAIRMAIGGAAMADQTRREELYRPQLAPYVDLLDLPDGGSDKTIAWLQEVDPGAAVVVGPSSRGAARAQPADDVEAMIDSVLGELGSDVTMHAWQATDVTAAGLRALGHVSNLLTGEISSLDPAAAGLSLRIGSTDASGTLRHHLLFDNRTFATYLVYGGVQGRDPLQISLVLPVEGIPGAVDVISGARSRLANYTREQSTGRMQASASLTGRTMVIDFNEGAADVMVERSGVSAARALTIGEIIARHQQQQRAQDAVVKDYVAHARMEQHFRPTLADPGYDVVTENRYFVAGAEVEWEELSFSVNGTKWGADRPAFPLIQPEKVLSLPLQLRFDDGYRYKLAGSERVDGYDCYVVRFEPVRQDSALYTGTVWIDRKTFARVRVQAVQGGLSAPVISNDETQHYSPVVVGNRPVFLFSGLTARQILLIAGRNLLVEKSVEFGDFHVNAEAFDRDRASARESNRVMYRETVRGLRYFVKENGTRVVSDRPTNHAKAMAIGTTIDPSYSFPLPMLGIDYLNFQFGSPNQQLAILFAGVLAAGNIQRSKIGHTHLDASVDFFAIATPSSDRLYGPNGEAAAERVLTWPLSTGFNLGWQATPFQKATFQYQFRFDGYVKDRTTADTFVVPSSTVTQGLGGAWEYRRAGYSLLLNGTWFGRAAWQPWGVRDQPALAATTTSPQTYTKYSAALSRDFYLPPFQKIHVNGGWFSGSDLDRFGKYQFGMFDDTRIHGVPASGVRYGELAMVRGSYSLDIFQQYRVDLFVDRAWGRDDPGHGLWDPITGVGVALNLRAPWNTMLRVDVGKSLLPARYSTLGSTTLQILLLKPLK